MKWQDLPFWGKEDFISEIKEKYLKDKKGYKDLPAMNALADRISTDDIHKAVESACSDDTVLERNIKIYLTKRYTGKRLREIGDTFGIGDAAVSQVCRRLAQRMEKDKKLKKSIEGVIKGTGPVIFMRPPGNITK